MPDKVPTPIHDAIPDATANAIIDFLDYLSSQGYHLCKWHDKKLEKSESGYQPYLPEGYYPEYRNNAQWVVESQGHSYHAWLEEKDAVLNAVREAQRQAAGEGD